MILKGSQRGSAIEFGLHLLKAANEHAEVHELRGFMAEDVQGAMKEAQAVAGGRGATSTSFQFRSTRQIRKPCLSPPSSARLRKWKPPTACTVSRASSCSMSRKAAAMRIASGRGSMSKGMKARPLPFFKNKLREVSKSIYLENGWRMPMGLIDSSQRNPLNFSLAEWQQA